MALQGHPLVQQEVLELRTGEPDESVEEGSDLQGGGVVVDWSDFGSGTALVVLNSESRRKGMGEELLVAAGCVHARLMVTLS